MTFREVDFLLRWLGLHLNVELYKKIALAGGKPPESLLREARKKTYDEDEYKSIENIMDRMIEERHGIKKRTTSEIDSGQQGSDIKIRKVAKSNKKIRR